MPVQRIPRYSLLLSDILKFDVFFNSLLLLDCFCWKKFSCLVHKLELMNENRHTDESHADYKNLKEAVDKIGDVAQVDFLN